MENLINGKFFRQPLGMTQLFFDKLFFSPDYLSMGSRLSVPCGCGPLTLEHFEKSKMAAKIELILTEG